MKRYISILFQNLLENHDYKDDEIMAKLMTLLKSIAVDYNPLMAMMIMMTKLSGRLSVTCIHTACCHHTRPRSIRLRKVDSLQISITVVQHDIYIIITIITIIIIIIIDVIIDHHGQNQDSYF